MSDQNKDKAIDKVKTLEEIKSHLGRLQTVYDPALVLREAEEKLSKPRTVDEDDDGEDEVDESEKQTSYADPVFKAMTLSEFKNGVIMVTVIPEQYTTFSIDMLRKLQEEYSCTTISEQATAELATVSYIRTLEIQNRMKRYLDMGTLTDNGVKFLAIMSKDLDRANRHYLTAIQALRAFKQPQLGMNIKANTAIIGQNQVVQANNNTNDY